jgi:hypothetical protein
MKNVLKEVSSDKDTIETISPDKVSLPVLRKIWDDEQHIYTDEELVKIREWLYVIANMIISVSQRVEKENTVDKNQQINEHEITQGYPLCEGEYRRAS